MERFACSRVKDLSQFVLWVIAERGLDIHETECHLNLDKGGDVLKLTLTIIQEQEVEGEPLSSGVKKSFIVCGIAKVKESHPVIKYVFDKTNVMDVRHEKFKEWRIGKTSNQIKLGAKLFFNVRFLLLIDRHDIEDLDVPVRKVFALDELQLVTGVFQKLYKVCKQFFSFH